MKISLFSAAAIVLLATACGGRSADKGNAASAEPDIVAAAFDADSAYAAVKAQVDMGPRNPGSAGHTAIVGWLQNELKRRGAASVEIFALLEKPARRKVDVDVKYKGYEIPDEFVVGFGLDYDERYRNLDSIAVLKPAVYQGGQA